MGVYQPANTGLRARVRLIAAAVFRSIVRRERAYILPWVASRDLETAILLENNQTEYSRRRRGLGTTTVIDVTQFASDGRSVLSTQAVVKPGAPVVLRAKADQATIAHGFYQLTDASQFYVQIVGPGSFALTHGRSSVITHFPWALRPALQAAARLTWPYRKGFNFIYTETLYETILILNLSSIRNLIDIDVEYSSGKRAQTRISLQPFGSVMYRFNEEIIMGEAFVTGFARMRSTASFDFYVLQTRGVDGREIFSIQHVN